MYISFLFSRFVTYWSYNTNRDRVLHFKVHSLENNYLTLPRARTGLSNKAMFEPRNLVYEGTSCSHIFHIGGEDVAPGQEELLSAEDEKLLHSFQPTLISSILIDWWFTFEEGSIFFIVLCI